MIRREICEELGYRAREVELFTEYRLVMPFPEPKLERLTFSRSRHARPRYRCSSSTKAPIFGSFRLEELASEAHAVPWGLAAV